MAVSGYKPTTITVKQAGYTRTFRDGKLIRETSPEGKRVIRVYKKRIPAEEGGGVSVRPYGRLTRKEKRQAGRRIAAETAPRRQTVGVRPRLTGAPTAPEQLSDVDKVKFYASQLPKDSEERRLLERDIQVYEAQVAEFEEFNRPFKPDFSKPGFGAPEYIGRRVVIRPSGNPVFEKQIQEAIRTGDKERLRELQSRQRASIIKSTEGPPAYGDFEGNIFEQGLAYTSKGLERVGTFAEGFVLQRGQEAELRTRQITDNKAVVQLTKDIYEFSGGAFESGITIVGTDKTQAAITAGTFALGAVVGGGGVLIKGSPIANLFASGTKAATVGRIGLTAVGAGALTYGGVRAITAPNPARSFGRLGGSVLRLGASFSAGSGFGRGAVNVYRNIDSTIRANIVTRDIRRSGTATTGQVEKLKGLGVETLKAQPIKNIKFQSVTESKGGFTRSLSRTQTIYGPVQRITPEQIPRGPIKLDIKGVFSAKTSGVTTTGNLPASTKSIVPSYRDYGGVLRYPFDRTVIIGQPQFNLIAQQGDLPSLWRGNFRPVYTGAKDSYVIFAGSAKPTVLSGLPPSQGVGILRTSITQTNLIADTASRVLPGTSFTLKPVVTKIATGTRYGAELSFYNVGPPASLSAAPVFKLTSNYAYVGRPFTPFSYPSGVDTSIGAAGANLGDLAPNFQLTSAGSGQVALTETLSKYAAVKTTGGVKIDVSTGELSPPIFQDTGTTAVGDFKLGDTPYSIVGGPGKTAFTPRIGDRSNIIIGGIGGTSSKSDTYTIATPRVDTFTFDLSRPREDTRPSDDVEPISPIKPDSTVLGRTRPDTITITQPIEATLPGFAVAPGFRGLGQLTRPTQQTTFLGFPTLPETPQKRVLSFPAYNVLVRRRGQFKTVATGLPRFEALSTGAGIVRGSAAATFRVEQAGTTTRRGFGIPLLSDFTRKGEDTFIEKRERRIKSRGEIAEITLKGLRTIRGGFKL